MEPRVFTTEVRTAGRGAGATTGPYKVPFGTLVIGRVGGPARGEDVMAREWRRGFPPSQLSFWPCGTWNQNSEFTPGQLC